MKFYDVSISISEDLPVWPGDPGISVKQHKSIARGDQSNVTHLELGVHSGTHIDAPFHFEPEGASVDQIPLEVLIGKCRVFDITHVKESIDRPDLEKLNLHGVVRALFKTKNSEWWARGEREFQKNYIYLTEEGAGFLVDKGVGLVGVDYLSVERFKNPDHPTHHILLQNRVVIIEGLNLSDVPDGVYELMALPMKIRGADGAPTRVVLRDLQV